VLAELLGGPLLQLHAAPEPEVTTLLDWVRVPAGAGADGRSVAELRLRETAGATIVAVLRDDDVYTEPDAGFVLQAHDVVVITGGTADLPRGRRTLTATAAPTPSTG
jgi:K+/H+ antiporter YhaU regulatory subunit KhtT